MKNFVWEKPDVDNEKNTADQSTALAAIDWKGTLQLVGLSPSEVEQMLDICVEELEKSNALFKSTYQAKNMEALSEALRHCLSGTCYLRLPDLNPAMQALRETAQEKPVNTAQLDTCYEALQNAISNFFRDYRVIKKQRRSASG